MTDDQSSDRDNQRNTIHCFLLRLNSDTNCSSPLVSSACMQPPTKLEQAYLPTDLYVQSAPLTNYPTAPHVFFPTNWGPPIAAQGAVSATQLTFTLPQSGALVGWTSRLHRKRLTQLVPLTNVPRRRTACERLFHFRPWDPLWYSVIMVNLGSHSLLYAGITAFIPFMYNSAYWWTWDIGWTLWIAIACWFCSNVIDMFVLAMTPNISRYYKPVEPQHSVPSQCGFFRRLLQTDWLIQITFLLAIIGLGIGTFADSGSFWKNAAGRLPTNAEQGGLVYFCDIFGGVFLVMYGWLTLAEACHGFFPSPLQFTRLDVWSAFLVFLGCICFFIWALILPSNPYPGQLEPWYPLLIAAVLFTVGHGLEWIEATEPYVVLDEAHNAKERRLRAENGGVDNAKDLEAQTATEATVNDANQPEVDAGRY